jgi:5-methylcytosine-specific restriction endonuclease McrA
MPYADPAKQRAHGAQYRAAHREELRAYDAARNARPERRRARAAYDARPERRRARAAYDARPERRRARAAYDARPERRLAHALGNARRAARKYGVWIDPALTLEAARVALLPVQECHWCGAPHGEDWELDHRWPLSRGGAHRLLNTVISCRACNQAKRAKTEAEFLHVLPDILVRRLTDYPSAHAYLAQAA